MPVSTMGNVANRSILYQQFADGGAEEVGIVPAPWTGIDEAELIMLRNGPIAIGDTTYGRFEEQKKRDVERVYGGGGGRRQYIGESGRQRER